jgi:hypothetical protein
MRNQFERTAKDNEMKHTIVAVSTALRLTLATASVASAAFGKLPAGNSKAVFSAMLEGGKLVPSDEKGTKSTVSIANVMQSKGVIHVTDSVALPN